MTIRIHRPYIPTKSEWEKIRPKRQIALIESRGWVLDRIKGNHKIFIKDGKHISYSAHGNGLLQAGTNGNLYKQLFEDDLNESLLDKPSSISTLGASILTSSSSRHIPKPPPAAPSLSSSRSTSTSTSIPATPSLSSSISVTTSTSIPATPSLSSSISVTTSTPMPAAPSLRSRKTPLSVEQEALKLYALLKPREFSQSDVEKITVHGKIHFYKDILDSLAVVQAEAREQAKSSQRTLSRIEDEITQLETDQMKERIKIYESCGKDSITRASNRASNREILTNQLENCTAKYKVALQAKDIERDKANIQYTNLKTIFHEINSRFKIVLSKWENETDSNSSYDLQRFRARRHLSEHVNTTIYNSGFSDLYVYDALPGCDIFLNILRENHLQGFLNVSIEDWDEAIALMQPFNSSMSLEWKLISYLILINRKYKNQELETTDRLLLERILREVNEPDFKRKIAILSAAIPEIEGIGRHISHSINRLFSKFSKVKDLYKPTLREPPCCVPGAASLISGETDRSMSESPFGTEISSSMMASSLSSSAAPALTSSPESTLAIAKPYVKP